MLFLDIETADDSLVCIGWAIDDQPVQSSQTISGDIRLRLADANEIVVTHSGYDVRFLHGMGVTVKCQQFDTQVMCWLVNENLPLSLAFSVNRYLGIELDKTLQKQAGTAPYADIAAYCEKDVQVTRELYLKVQSRLKDDGLWDYFELTEAPFTKVLRDMEFAGMPVNLTDTEALLHKYAVLSNKLEGQITTGFPTAFNPRSPVHVAKYLGSRAFKLGDRMTKADNATNLALNVVANGGIAQPSWWEEPPGTFITEKEGRLYDHGFWVMKGIGHGIDAALASVARPALLDSPTLAANDWVVNYLKYKKYDKLIGTYLKVFPERAVQGRIHSRFNQTGTTTGRLSSSEPNLQNIPSRGEEGSDIRGLFQGKLIVGDFSQLEPRLMAHFSQDPGLVAAFTSSGDIYEEVAIAVGCTRTSAKTLVLAMSYGAGPKKVAQTLRLNGYPGASDKVATDLLRDLHAKFPHYFLWREAIIADWQRVGYIKTIDGRMRRQGIDQSAGGWKDPSAPGRQAANAIVQGSAADVVRRVMLTTTKMFPQLTLLAQIHDELVYEVADSSFGDPKLLSDLNRWVLKVAQRGISVPLVFDAHYGTSWLEAKEGTWKGQSG